MGDKKLILLIGLSLLALASLVYGIFSPSSAKRRPSSSSTLSEGVKSNSLPSPIEKGPSKRTEYPSWGRNPFLPQGVETSRVGKFILHGISWDEKNPRAVINGQIVGVGHHVGEIEVVEIKKDRVTLSDGSTNFELRIGRRK